MLFIFIQSLKHSPLKKRLRMRHSVNDNKGSTQSSFWFEVFFRQSQQARHEDGFAFVVYGFNVTWTSNYIKWKSTFNSVSRWQIKWRNKQTNSVSCLHLWSILKLLTKRLISENIYRSSNLSKREASEMHWAHSKQHHRFSSRYKLKIEEWRMLFKYLSFYTISCTVFIMKIAIKLRRVRVAIRGLKMTGVENLIRGILFSATHWTFYEIFDLKLNDPTRPSRSFLPYQNLSMIYKFCNMNVKYLADYTSTMKTNMTKGGGRGRQKSSPQLQACKTSLKLWPGWVLMAGLSAGFRNVPSSGYGCLCSFWETTIDFSE